MRSKTTIVALALAVAFCLFMAPGTADAKHSCCEPCCETCCPPPPVKTVMELKDPCSCSCCPIEVTLCVPACCGDEAPCVSWRSGIFGRRVATLSWECCGYRAMVVVTRSGRVIVRG